MEQQHLQPEERAPRIEPWLTPNAMEAPLEGGTEDATALTLETPQVEALAANLTQEVKAQRKNLLVGLPGLLVVTAVLGVLTDWLSNALGPEGWRIAGAVFTLGFLAAAAGFIGGTLKPRQRRRKLANTLANQGGLQAIGPLVDSLSGEDGRMHEIAIEGLIRLLPGLKASDAALLGPVRQAVLCHVLNLPAEQPLFSTVGYVFRRPNDNDIEIRVAILKAFEQVGDAKALPIVTHLATGTAKTPGQQRIQKAAQDCLPALQLRADQHQNSQVLLRASHAADASPETLLRAASSAAETPSEQLLRPGQPLP